MKVINLFGSPGCGKSTTASELFVKMKKAGYKVEIIHELAKDLLYAKNEYKLQDQIMIFAEQHHRQWIMQGQVDYVINDGNFLLSTIYGQKKYKGDTFNKTIIQTFNEYDNLNVILLPQHEYQEHGRFQTKEEAESIENKIFDTFHNYGIEYTSTYTNEALDYIKKELNLNFD